MIIRWGRYDSNSSRSTAQGIRILTKATDREQQPDYARYSSPRVLFWNVHNRDLTDTVCCIAGSVEADVIILVENSVSSSTTLMALQQNVCREFYIPSSITERRFHCFCRNERLDLAELHSAPRSSYRRFRIGDELTLLCCIHGLDMRNYDTYARNSFAQDLANDLRFVSDDKGIGKIAIIGDFNMNPYDSGMNLATGFNAMMTKTCVAKGALSWYAVQVESMGYFLWGCSGSWFRRQFR